MILLFRGGNFTHVFPDGAAKVGGDGFTINLSLLSSARTQVGGSSTIQLFLINIDPDGASVVGGDGVPTLEITVISDGGPKTGGDGFSINITPELDGAAKVGGDENAKGFGFGSTLGGSKVGGDGADISITVVV